MSNLLDLDDDDFFVSRGESSSATSKDLDEIFGISKQSKSDNLDDVFRSDTSEKKPLSEKQLEDLFGKAEDDEFDFFARGDGDALSSKAKEEDEVAEESPAVYDDFFNSLGQTGSSQPDSTKMSDDQSDLKSPDLDFLLKAQPAGMVDSTDDLLMLDPFTELPKANSPVLNPKVKKSTELKIDPSDDFFADAPLSPKVNQSEPSQPLSETGSKMETGSQEANNGKPKRSMERSFEDLLHGLSDESDPDLDDMITHDTDYSGNLESLITSPDKSQAVPYTDEGFGTPDKNLDSFVDMDLMSSTPNVEHEPSEDSDDVEEDNEIPEVRVENPEGIVESPESDLEEQDFKSWEMVDKEDVEKDDGDDVDGDDDDDDDDDDEEEGNENNSALGDDDGVVMRRRRRWIREDLNGVDDQREESIDLSAIEDANQLDVDINKQKSELSKRGSLALRRKPSRKNRRSLLSTGEDDIFKDSTQPKSQALPNGNGDVFDQRDADMSPPPKKPSPGLMMPLPGMATRPPRRMSSGSADDDAEMVYEPRKMSKPPPGAFRLPAVTPRPAKTGSEVSPQSPPSVFKKPSLRSVNRTPSSPDKDETKSFETSLLKGVPRSHDVGRGGSEKRENNFETPALKSISRSSKKTDSEGRDVTFEKPTLRSTPKREGDSDLGTFVKPSLRSTPKHVPRDIEKNETAEPPSSKYEIPLLRDAPKRTTHDKNADADKYSFGKPKNLDVDKRTFDKLALRNRRMYDNEVKDSDKESRTYLHDEPNLSRTHSSRTESPVNEANKKLHAFGKPVLRNTSGKVESERKDSDSDYKFTKPALRKSPERVKDIRSENKGYFDKPSLRKTENLLSEEKAHTSDKDYSSGFPEMKLRKTRPPPTDNKEKSSEKPEWLQAAKSKHSKALDALQSKENCNGTSEKPSPSWLEKAQLRKSANQVPLQETSQNLSGSMSSDITDNQSSDDRSRVSSFGSADGENSKERDKKSVRDNNYTPSWMRQGRSPSVPGFVPLTPAKSCSSIPPANEEVPQWKKELVQRRQSRKTTQSETPKKEESPEPEWKTNVHLRKVRHTPGPVKDATTAEPEWKKAAEEKKARLRSKSLQFSHLKVGL